MSRHAFRVVLALGFVCAAVVAHAQSESIPVLVPDLWPEDTAAGAEGTDDSEPIETPVETPTGQWDYSVGAGGGWESDVTLQPGGEGPSDFGGSAFFNVSWQGNRPRSRIRFAGGGSGILYAEQSDYNRWDGDAAFVASRQLSRTTRGSLGASAGYGYTDTSSILSDQGLILPLTRAVNVAGTLGLETRLSSADDARLDVRLYRVEFPETDALQDSTSLRLTGTLDHRFGLRDTLSGEYSAEGSTGAEGARSYWVHYMSASWQRAISRETSFRIRGGASYQPSLAEGVDSQAWRFYGGASLRRSIRDSTVGVSFRREVLPAFGLDTLRFTDRVTLTAAVPLGEDWQLDLAAYYMRDAEAGGSGGRLSSTDGAAGLATRLSRRFWLTARGRYYHRDSLGAIPPLENYRAGLFVVYGNDPGLIRRY